MKVIMIPRSNQYIVKLADLLRKDSVKVKQFKSFHYSAPSNFIKTFFYRLVGYKIIHIHWVYVFPFSFIMKSYIKFAKRLGYKIIWTVHNVHPHEHTDKEKDKTIWFGKNVDYFFIHYESNVSKLEKYTGSAISKKKITVINHPSYEEIYPNKISKVEARIILGIPQSKKVVLCFGQIRKYKGVDLFQQGMELLDNDYHGLIVGEIKDRDLFEAIDISSAAMDNLMIVPRRVTEDEVQIYLNACDVVVMPYEDVATSGVALLAYAFSRPILSTKVGCMSEILEEGKTGLFIDDWSGIGVKTAILKIFKKDYEKMGDDAYEYSKKFTWDELREKTIEGYREVLK